MPFCMRYYHGGSFVYKKGKTEYVGGGLLLDPGLSDISFVEIMEKARKIVGTERFDVWYRLRGRNLNNGRRRLISESDIPLLLESRDAFDIVSVWVIVLPQQEEPPLTLSPLSPRTKNLMLRQFLSDDVGPTAAKKQRSSCNKSFSPLRRSPRGHIPPKSSKNTSQNTSQNTQERTHVSKSLQFSSQEIIPIQIIHPPSTHVGTSGRLSKLTVRRRPETVNVQENEEIVEDFSSSSDASDIEEQFQVTEEDRVVGDELFYEGDFGGLLNSIRESLNEIRSEQFQNEEDAEDEPPNNTVDPSCASTGLFGVDNLVVRLENESDGDSEELRSIQGSDTEVEVDPNPIFNPEVDFKKKIVLKQGLKFPTVVDLRLALKQHAIENGYDFFYLHNGRKKVTIYCVNKCDCEWDNVRSKVKACTCNNPDKCLFKVYAHITMAGDAIQLRTVELEHSCAFSSYSRQVTSEFLANKYLEKWRITPSWKLKEFKDQVFQDLLVEVGYSKLWRARARAKLLIHGTGSDEYKRVYDYAAALVKYNPGSSTYVVCESVQRPIQVFQRMYVCLEPCKQGFVRGCRPIIGVDGCHLKGPYPGMCLVAVGKDGNNNIFPIAWAVVEVENTASWRWFLVLLLNDVGRNNEEGEGLTFMSDRQKGLIEAFSTVTPKADIRFCVRHIWANFKLHFPGMAFRDSFWEAAKSRNRNDFLAHMEKIRALKPEAHDYLSAIPPENWSRHAFTFTAKSDMLLNNLCETFNSVLREARDKPILTQMEWIRRYIMLRNCEKREGVTKYKEMNMPFVYKYFTFARDQLKFCKCFGSIIDKWEVEYMSDRHDVNIMERTCSCNHWQLTGIPCVHAYACIVKQRGDPHKYVDAMYSKAVYQLAYEPIINTMPGPKLWDRTKNPQPEPPAFRRLPGRPFQKKRRKEPDEGKGKKRNYVKRIRRPNKCGKCGQLGHNKSTCKNPPAPAQPKDKGGRPISTSEWALLAREKRVRRQAAQAGVSQEQTEASCSNAPQTQQSQAG